MHHEYEPKSVLLKTFADTSQNEISAEYNLPDYLPDINRLLKISAKILSCSHALAGDAVEYEGKLKCAILYATGDGALKSAEFEREFSGTAAVSGTSGDCDIRLEPQIGAVTCRLQNPRKLTAKLKLILSASVLCEKNISPVITGKLNGEDEKTLEARTESIAALRSATAEEKNTPISEDIELDAGLPAIEEIASVELDPHITDIRAESGKITYKGDILATILYLAEKEETETVSAPKYTSFTAKIPISGEIDAPEVTEKYIPFAEVSVSSPEFRPQSNPFGENRTAEIDLSYSVTVSLFCNEESTLTTDMYSTAYESTCEAEKLTYDSVLMAKTFNFTAGGSTKCEDPDFSRLVSATAAVHIDRTEKAGNKLLFFGTAAVSAILTNGEGIYLAKNFEIPLRAEADGSHIPAAFEAETRPAVLAVSAKQDGDTLSVSLEILVSYILFEKHAKSYVETLSVYKDRPVETGEDASLVLCYPARGDSLWDIAKKYSTTTLSLMEANSISAETTPAVLVIPRRTSPLKKGYRLL